MKDMNLVISLDKYSIYNNNKYYLCMPKEDSNFYHVFMSFSEKDLPTLSKEELLKEISFIANAINNAYKNGIYVLPIIPPEKLKEATNENDDKSYNKILNNFIQPITYEIYNLLSSKQLRVSQTIKMIKKNDIDIKLISWISLKLGNVFIKEINFINTPNEPIYKEIESTTYNNSSIFLDYEVNKNEIYIDDSLKAATSPGYGSLGLIIMILSISSVFIGAIIYMIIK